MRCWVFKMSGKKTLDPKKFIGKKFGMLTVESVVVSNGSKSKLFCRCDCGGNKVVPYVQLKNGQTRSCGCLKRKSIQKWNEVGKAKTRELLADDVSRRKYLSVTESLSKNSTTKHKGVSTYRDKDGQIKSYRAYIVVDGKQIHGGTFQTLQDAIDCRQRLEEKYFQPLIDKVKSAKTNGENLTGKIYGRLVAISPTEKRVNGRVVWHCKCECGNEVDVPSSYLTSGEIQSCGCLRKEKLKDIYDPSSLFLGKEPRKDSSTGYRGVSRYLTRKSKEERFRAWITVGGKRYYKSGF